MTANVDRLLDSLMRAGDPIFVDVPPAAEQEMQPPTPSRWARLLLAFRRVPPSLIRPKSEPYVCYYQSPRGERFYLTADEKEIFVIIEYHMAGASMYRNILKHELTDPARVALRRRAREAARWMGEREMTRAAAFATP